jgi:Flp pilus assembly CpaF family ATPase
VHANGPVEALARVETLALLGGLALPLTAIRAQLAAAVDAVVHVGRGDDGRRVVLSVAEVESDGARVRTLLARRGAELVPVNAPRRPARRTAVDLAAAWFAC